MAVHEGFEYEKNVFEALKKMGIAGGIPPAGAAHDRPDLEIVKKNMPKAGVELKNQPTSAGSLVLQYSNGKWNFGPTRGNPEKEFLKRIGMSVKVLDFLNKNWKDPALVYMGNSKTYPKHRNWKDAYNHDLKKFGNQYIDVKNIVIADYYGRKHTPYLNVGNKGFFIFKQTNDPLSLQSEAQKKRLPKIPVFSDPKSATTKIRVRVQEKGGGYQFAFTLQFGGVISSPYNLGPILKNTRSRVDEESLTNNLFMKLFE